MIIAEQNRLNAEREAANAARAEQDRAQRAAADASDSERFTRELNEAMGFTRSAAQQRLQGMGLDPNAYNDRIDRELNMTRLRIPERAQGVGQFFNTDFVDTLLNEDRSARRTGATARVQRELPGDFSSMFSTSADDPFIDAILGRQSGEAQAQLERARARGNLTDTGFQSGVGRISELERSARAQAQALGDSVIERFRGRAGDVRNRALERAGSLDIFEPDFDITPFSRELEEVRGTFNNNLGGEIEGALAGQSFFDIGDILNRAGVAQGSQNPSATNELSPAAALAERQRRQREQAQRGVGGEGSF
jgi:hypothetical protein